jgi:RHH-type rel operon transcriptional repressor/antitoxin RelB
MSQVTARIPDELVSALDQAARGLNRSRADIIRQAIELYLDDFEDLTTAVERLRDPSDTVLDWDQVKRELLDQD